MYTNQELVEAQLGRQLTGDEATMFELISIAVDEYINEQTGVSFSTTDSITRKFDVEGNVVELGAAYDITEVKLNNAATTSYVARPLNSPVTNWLELARCAGGFAEVTAKFGYPSVPKDIEYAATYLASQLYISSESGNLKSESIEGYSRTFGEFVANNNTVQMVLSRYYKTPLIRSC